MAVKACEIKHGTLLGYVLDKQAPFMSQKKDGEESIVGEKLDLDVLEVDGHLICSILFKKDRRIFKKQDIKKGAIEVENVNFVSEKVKKLN